MTDLWFSCHLIQSYVVITLVSYLQLKTPSTILFLKAICLNDTSELHIVQSVLLQSG